MKGLKATLVCGLLVCAMIGVSMVAIGGRPPPTPPPTGTVYFSYADMGLKGYSLWKMNAADGSGKARVGAERCLYADGTGSNLGQLSWFPHGGHYWLSWPRLLPVPSA